MFLHTEIYMRLKYKLYKFSLLIIITVSNISPGQFLIAWAAYHVYSFPYFSITLHSNWIPTARNITFVDKMESLRWISVCSWRKSEIAGTLNRVGNNIQSISFRKAGSVALFSLRISDIHCYISLLVFLSNISKADV